jgi:hypothetical protein
MLTSGKNKKGMESASEIKGNGMEQIEWNRSNQGFAAKMKERAKRTNHNPSGSVE